MTNLNILEHILESLPEGIVGHDRERRIIYFNRAAEAITGWPRQQVLGKDCHEAFGAPFYGKHCAFGAGTPASQVNRAYSINIVTKELGAVRMPGVLCRRVRPELRRPSLVFRVKKGVAGKIQQRSGILQLWYRGKN